MRKYVKAAIFVAFCEAVGVAGSVFTGPAIPTWYATLQKPLFNPPNWVFGPVWTLLYALMGIAAYLVFESGRNKREVRTALTIFGIQLALNFLWSGIFFGLRNPELAFVEICALWTAILLCIRSFHRIVPTAAYLMIPYLLWVSFALLLNLSIAVLN